MPIYAYRCASCGHSKDVLQKLSEPALSVCPACGAPTFSKQVTAAGFQLKGSGWYATDFKNTAAAKKAGDSASGDGKAGGEQPSSETPKTDASKPVDTKSADTRPADTKSADAASPSKSVPGEPKGAAAGTART